MNIFISFFFTVDLTEFFDRLIRIRRNAPYSVHYIHTQTHTHATSNVTIITDITELSVNGHIKIIVQFIVIILIIITLTYELHSSFH